jgi:hypothetical protein
MLVAASFLGISAASSVTAVTELTSNLARAEREVWVQNQVISSCEAVCANMLQTSGPSLLPPDTMSVILPGGITGTLSQDVIGVPAFTGVYEVRVALEYTELQRGKEVIRTFALTEYVRQGGG